MPADEMAVPQKNIHAQPGKALDRIIRRNLCANAANTPHHIGKLHGWRLRFYAELTRLGHRIGCTRRTNQSFRWHASIVEAIAAGKSAFNQRYACAQYRRTSRL